jgi:hypothetical protein
MPEKPVYKKKLAGLHGKYPITSTGLFEDSFPAIRSKAVNISEINLIQKKLLV